MERLPSLSASRWCPIFSDVNRARRGQGDRHVTELAGRCGIARIGESMAFGDGGNDAADAACGRCRAWRWAAACAEALEAADWVTASVDDDGIRRALEHFGVIAGPGAE